MLYSKAKKGESMKGSLIYVMGPSGAGKDSLLEIAKTRFAGNPDIEFTKRYVTREAALGGEDFIAVSQADFDRLEAEDFFLFTWQSHGLSYGCDRMIERRLAEGKLVLLNGSRAYLPRAMELLPSLTPLIISARPEILAARLKGRGRETATEQAERLNQPDYSFLNIRSIDNSGPLENAAEEFLAFLNGELTKLKCR
jgi:ribose 1,5-bisphosphokinase